MHNSKRVLVRAGTCVVVIYTHTVARNAVFLNKRSSVLCFSCTHVCTDSKNSMTQILGHTVEDKHAQGRQGYDTVVFSFGCSSLVPSEWHAIL